jgi:DNA ligase (NAD+)
MTIKEQIKLFLRSKYEYYILCEPKMLDSDFDKLEESLRNSGDKLALDIVDLTDFPGINVIEKLGFSVEEICPEQKVKRDETKHKHITKMLSIQKINIKDESNFPYNDIKLFFDRIKTNKYICEPKYDGNAINLIYENGILKSALTRNDGDHGLERINKIRLIVPNRINIQGLVEIRGECLIKKTIFEEKYKEEGSISNPRNFVAGAISRENVDIKAINDLVFIGYSLMIIENGKKTYVDDTLNVLKQNGFNKNHTPFVKLISEINEFEEMYFEFKKYREECEFLLDGIVIKYEEKYRIKLGDNGKYEKWSIAIKFIPEIVSTKIIDIQWLIGKDGSFTPVADLEPVELMDTIVKKASLSNLGTMHSKKLYIGAVCTLVKSGDIIPMITSVLIPSENEKEYDKQIDDFIKQSK